MKTVETYEKLKAQFGELKEIFSLADLVGQTFFFRSVTYHLVGRVTKQINNFIELDDASWVADSGRFSNAIKEGKLEELEPVGKAFLNLDTVVDFFPWVHPLPTKQQ